MTTTRFRLAAATMTTAVVAFSAAGCGLDILRTTSTDETILDDAVSSVEFDLRSGSVTVTSGEETKLTRTIRHAGDPPEATHTVEDGTLTLEDCPQTGCDIDYALVVGTDARVEGASGSGDLTVTGVAAAVIDSGSGDTHLADLADTAEVHASSGDVLLERIGGGALARLKSGSVRATGIGETLDVEASSGDVAASDIGGDLTAVVTSGSLDLALAHPADVRAESNSGDIAVTVPDGSYRVTTEAGSGDVTDDLAHDPDGEFTVQARTGSGDIRLRHP